MYLRKLNDKNNKIRIGVLTNEIPPIIYGGIATWILNFLEMFKDDSLVELIPIYFSYQDKDTSSIKEQNYKKIRFIDNDIDIVTVFKDIDICVNNLWINLDIIKRIIDTFPNIHMISVCHSLIIMEDISNNKISNVKNYYKQEIVFKYSNYIVFVSNSEKNYYESFGYGKYKAIPIVINNIYIPKYDNIDTASKIDYSNNNVWFIETVPRKRPELPILSVKLSKRKDIEVYNIGVNKDRIMSIIKKNFGEKYLVITDKI